jgi:hypothetical protein
MNKYQVLILSFRLSLVVLVISFTGGIRSVTAQEQLNSLQSAGGWQIETVASVGDVGRISSVAVDSLYR